MGKLIPFLFIALDGKSAVAHLRLRIPGHKLRGSWFSFRWSPVRIVIGSHGLIATVFYFKNYATGIQRQHGMPGSCGHLQHRTGFPYIIKPPGWGLLSGQDMNRVTFSVVAIMLLAAATTLPFVLNAGFGKAPQGAQLSQVEASPHYRDGQFHNQLPTPGFTGQKNMLAAWWDFLMTKRENARPAQPLPLVKTDLATLPLGQDVMVWLGHSSWYLQLAGKRILIDPVFSDYAAPFSFINKAFPGDYPWRAEGMPEIDLLIISHDHYDHLDYATIRALLPKIKRVITPLGVGSHLRYWGMDGALITEADWQQAVPASDELTVHVLPARHFSGRGLKRNQTLWASFLFVTRQQKIYYSGDSGYGPHFKAIGNEFGPVDLAIMENGQYDQDWKYIHMMPDETAQAADDLRARAVLPGHAGRFVLAKHSWDEPYQRLAAASEGRAWRLLTPVQGEPVWVADKTQSFNAWWR